MQPFEPSENDSSKLPDELVNFESSLLAFQPKSVAINRDQLMFDAGHAAARAEILASSASQRRSLRLWQSVAAALMLVSSGLGTSVLTRSEPETRIVYVEREHIKTSAESDVDTNPSVIGLANNSATPVQATVGASPSDSGRDEPIHDSAIELPRELEIVHARNVALAQVLDANSANEKSSSEASDNRLERPLSRQPLLSPGVLMTNQKSRNWINRLIEDPTL